MAIDWSAEIAAAESAMRKNQALIDAGETFAGVQATHRSAPSKTDGKGRIHISRTPKPKGKRA
jgi:hypothetical protein